MGGVLQLNFFVMVNEKEEVMAKILFVHPYNRLGDDYLQCLESADHSIFWATKKEIALAILDSPGDPFDLIMVNYALEQYRVISLIQDIRCGHPDLRVVVLIKTPVVVAEFMRAGVESVVEKPLLNPREIVEVVRKLLKGKE